MSIVQRSKNKQGHWHVTFLQQPSSPSKSQSEGFHSTFSISCLSCLSCLSSHKLHLFCLPCGGFFHWLLLVTALSLSILSMCSSCSNRWHFESHSETALPSAIAADMQLAIRCDEMISEKMKFLGCLERWQIAINWVFPFLKLVEGF